MDPLIDPRYGDLEADASSTKARSLLALAGGLLAEISFPKLVLAWLLLVVLPGLALGLSPLLVSAWWRTVSGHMFDVAELWPALIVVGTLAVGWAGGRRLWRWVETSFWSLNSILVEPGYALCREVLRHLFEKARPGAGKDQRARARSIVAGAAGLVLAALSLAAVAAAWPHARFVGDLADFAAPLRLAPVALANSVVLVGIYLAVAAVIWGLADATMPQPRDLDGFAPDPLTGPVWRVVHLSDVHVVGETYGFRIESGRTGPRGNDRFKQLLTRLDAIHDETPLDLVLVTGDMTDAGSSGEWAAFLDLMAEHPRLAERVLILPGNHDVNVVDRANPARFDLPLSAGKTLRLLRTLSAMAQLQGDRVRVVDRDAAGRVGATLNAALAPHRPAIATFADAGGLREAAVLTRLWGDAFPQILPPVGDDGLGVVILNSNAETHFSFTNALGLISVEQARGLQAAAKAWPRAHWIVALHHHVAEYPRPPKALSERIGTALVNGSWFVRQLQSLGRRAIAMHGHRHVDWIGTSGSLVVVSAPSPVMEATNDKPTLCYIHRLAPGPDGSLLLLEPQTIHLAGDPDYRPGQLTRPAA
jgi:hypothetical protein